MAFGPMGYAAGCKRALEIPSKVTNIVEEERFGLSRSDEYREIMIARQIVERQKIEYFVRQSDSRNR